MSLLHTLKQSFSLGPSEGGATESCGEFEQEYSRINFERSRILALVLLVIHLPLLWRDIYVTKAAGLFEENVAYEHLFHAHLAAAVFCSVYSLAAWLINRRKIATYTAYDGSTKSTCDPVKRSMTYIFILVILCWAIILAGGIANQFHGQITEYIIALLGLVAAFYIPPRSSLLIVALGQGLFITVLMVTAESPNSGGHITNTLALAVIAWVISLVIFNGFKRSFGKSKTIAQQKASLERSHKELQSSNANLQRLNREKNELMGIVAHDLRNPLSAFRLSIGNLERYAERMSPAERSEQFTKLEQSTQRMLTLVNDLIEENAIESGGFAFEPEFIQLDDFMRTVMTDFEASAAAKQITLELQTIDPQLRVYSDPQRLTQVLSNLISNALKFTDANSDKRVRVSVRRDGDAVLFAVEDQGPGLSDADMQGLYSRFSRLSAKPTAGEKSSGLGLSIVKKIVDGYLGSIECNSTLGEGSCFTVRLTAGGNPTERQKQGV